MVDTEVMTKATVSPLNESISARATLFLEPDLIDALASVYRCTPRKLAVTYADQPVSAFHVKRPGTDRICFAPFNFQPVLRDLAPEIARAIVAMAKGTNLKSTARIKLHHILPVRIVDELDLKVASNSVETLLALKPQAEATIAALPKKQRWKLKTARADAAMAGVSVRRFTDEATLQHFYDIMLRAYRDKHRMIPQPYALLRNLLMLRNGKRSCDGYIAERKDGKVLGGIFVEKDEFQWSYAWAANVPDPNVESLGLGTLLVGQVICDAADAGISLFSFGVSPLSHDTLRKFKRNWGAEEHLVYEYFWNEKPHLSDLHANFDLAKQVLSISPLSVIRAASSIAVRWLV